MATDTEASTDISTPSVSMTTDREQKLHQDRDKLVSCCKLCPFVSVKSLTESSVSLEFTSGEKKVEYTVLHSSDYPSNTVVTNSNDPNDVKCYDQQLVTIFIDISKEWCKDHEMSLPVELESLCSTPSPLLSPTLDAQISVASSVASSEMSTDYSGEEDEMDYFDDYEDDVSVVSSLIHRDVEMFMKLYGENSIEQKIHACINEMDVLLYIDMGFLDVHTASAWGVDSDLPIVLHIHFQSVTDYLDGPEPKIEDCGNFYIKSLEEYVRLSPGTGMTHLSSLATPTNTPASAKSYPINVQKLVDMGFGPQQAEDALSITGDDLQRTIHLLTTGELLDEDEVDGAQKPKKKPDRQPSFGRQDSQGARAVLSLSDNLEEVKKAPSLANGFLAQIIKYTLNRIPSLNEFCVICDEKHVLETGLLKPCVCTRELCIFAFQSLGVMADAAESLATDGDVVDLMLAMCNAAANSSRAPMILDPYPSIVDPYNSQRLAMDPSRKDFDQVKTVMTAIIAGRNELLRGRCSHQSLKAVLDSHHTLAFPLMQWVVATNRAYIVLLPEDRQLKSMETNYQFLLISSPPAKELAFQEAKKKHGSTFAFHGSSIENWHSIMRKGLINASGTKYQLNGAACGSGIYLSPDANMSYGFSISCYGETSDTKVAHVKDSLAGKVGLLCIALCEVVTSKNLKRSDDVWLCSDSDHVVTRFFFVYDRATYNSALSLHTQSNKEFQEEITHAVDLAQCLKQKQ